MGLVSFLISTNLDVNKTQTMVSRNTMEIWPYCSHQVCIHINSIQYHGKTSRIYSTMIFLLYTTCCQHLPFIFHLPIPSSSACTVLHETTYPKGKPKEVAASYQLTDSRCTWSMH